METQALQEDRVQEQLQKDNRELLQKIQVSDIDVSVPKLNPTTTRTLQKMKHSACFEPGTCKEKSQWDLNH